MHGLRDDDLFVLSDADELPSPESLLFLRLYDGYTEPVRFGFRWNVFGFFWLKAEDPSALAKVPLLGKVRDCIRRGLKLKHRFSKETTLFGETIEKSVPNHAFFIFCGEEA